MKRIIVTLFSLGFIFFAVCFSATAKEQSKQSQKPSEQAEETVPLITEVMSKEELQTYLKEKGIPIIKKEDFKEPELVWEKTFHMPIEEISDLTEKGNCIVLSGSKFSSPDSKSNKKAILFLDSKGDLRKKMEFKDVEGKIEHRLFLAMSGHYAGVYEVNSKKKEGVFTYYDEDGNKLWTKGIKREDMWPGAIVVSYSGDVISVEKGNPYWGLESEKVGINLNINKLTFYDSKGNSLFEYKGFRNMSIGKLSDDGQYFVCILWLSKGTNSSENKLVYIKTKDGMVLWERPYPAYWNVDRGEEYELQLSEKGYYVAAVALGDKDRGMVAEGRVFDHGGKMVAKVKSRYVYGAFEHGFVDIGEIVDISMPKLLPRFFLPINQKREFWEDPREYIKVDSPIYNAYITKEGLYIKYVDSGKGKIRILRLRREAR